ncbi:cold shock domain-containing protein [Streptomyces sp. NPDC006638]|uniref:cold shock domain-containing protein n=1 Tax=Streptomyces sp. NPDC006638 TaxID=3157183 RepID=UPI0033A08391
MAKHTGTVESFDDKGSGFITPDDGGARVFVHFSAITATGFKTLEAGDRVSYDLQTGGNGPSAANVVKL